MKSKKIILSLCASSLFVCSSAFAFPVDITTGTPITEAVRALAFKAGKNVVVNGDLRGTMSMHMDDTDFETALKALSIAGNFSYEFVGDTVLVAPADKLNTIQTFKLKHLEPEVFIKQLSSIVSGENVVADKERNTITIAGSNSVMRRVENLIEKFDVAQQQVNIKATIIEISKTKNREMGLSYLSDAWSKDTSISGYNGFKFSVTGAHSVQDGILALIQEISGDIKDRKISVFFVQRQFPFAKLMMGDKVPVFTSSSDSTETDANTTMTVEYKDVGVNLEVLPRINDGDKETITMVIKPSVSTISQWVESGNNKAPQISERSAETTIRVKSGETILIGGLLKDEEIKNIRQIPFLSKLPILGELFKSRSIDKKNSEVLIAITPTIVYDEDGRPKVEMQTTTPKLMDQLHELQNEPVVSNSIEEEMLASDVELGDEVNDNSEIDYGNGTEDVEGGY